MRRLSWLPLLVLGCGSGSTSLPDAIATPDRGDAASPDTGADAAADTAGEVDLLPDGPDLGADTGTPARLVLDPTAHQFAGVAGCKGTPVVFRVTNSGESAAGPLVVTTGTD